MMRVYTVTAEAEDEREGQWTQTSAILAESPDAAALLMRTAMADRHGVPEPEVNVHKPRLWYGAQAPRIVATLTLRRGEPHWQDVR